MKDTYNPEQKYFCLHCGGNRKIGNKTCPECRGTGTEAFPDIGTSAPILNKDDSGREFVLAIFPNTFRVMFNMTDLIHQVRMISRQEVYWDATEKIIIVKTVGDEQKAQAVMVRCKKQYLELMGLLPRAPKKDDKILRVIKGNRRLRLVSLE